MSPTPLTQPPVEASGAALDERLRAWFAALIAQPVPEALLRHLEAVESRGDREA
jgi:hypothetical protein